MMIELKTIILPTKEPQYLYKDSRGRFGNYNPNLPKRTITEGLFPQFMYCITINQPVRAGDWYYDEIDKLVCKCTRIENGFIYSERVGISDLHGFKIIGSTDESLDVMPINENFLKIFCDTNGEPTDTFFNIDKSKIIVRQQTFTRTEVHKLLDKAINDTENYIASCWLSFLIEGGPKKEYTEETIKSFMSEWKQKNFSQDE